MKKSTDFYTEKYKKLTEESAACSIKIENFFNSGISVIAAEAEIKRAEQDVEKVKNLLKYFKELEKVLINSDVKKEEEFKTDLLKQDWKSALDKLVSQAPADDIAVSSEHLDLNVTKLKNRLFNERIKFYYETIEKKIKTYVDGLGWPKIVSNEETAEIISRLQELLTYGEAIYILSQRSICANFIDNNRIVDHPIKCFIDPIKTRFYYHFDSDRPTNQIEKPEWYFDHLIGICRESASFLREFILPCWRLRDFDDFLRTGVIEIAQEKTLKNMKILNEQDHDNTTSIDMTHKQQSLVIHHLMEMGKFLNTIQDEFGYNEIEGIVEKVFITETREEFVQNELERVKLGYSKLFNDNVDEWTTPNLKNPQMGEPSAPALKFLSFFHSSTILPYSFIKKDMKLRALLLLNVQSWLLEQFHDKCLFDCPPLHSSKESILKDIGMINSLAVIYKVLGDDFGESLVIGFFIVRIVSLIPSILGLFRVKHK